MKIIVHAPNWVGDHAMAFPFYAALRETFPQAELILVGRSWIADLKTPEFSEVIAFEGKNIRNGDFSRLRKIHFDLGFTLSPSFRSAWFLYRLKIRSRIGFASDMRSALLHFAAPYNRHEHRALAYTRLLKPFDFPEKLFAQHRYVKLLVTRAPRLGADVIICPGSTANSKKYPVDKFIQVIHGIAAKAPKAQFVLLGAKIDQAECEAIMNHFTATKIKVHSLCAQTSLAEAHAIIAGAKVCIANDSGLAHITSLTSTPIITWNGMGRRSETEPLTQKKVVFDLELSCSPCFKRECPRTDSPLACLTGIAENQVATTALKYLRRR